ncbi:MAG: hypothetical protein A3G34_16315 [Candidatus Lindowbacteria bacterium RIFCSPLOWO2_12_FULL_62_27]|nr:MAG: hypothetical protein A3G34_16315 [Candidatus Lindowbacteria bacterium RIFCSPLOWO2_12_FULL_62_27]
MAEQRVILREDVLALAQWVMAHPLIRENFALGGGTWLTLRNPRQARTSTDIDVFSPKEEVSSYRAMRELVQTCEKDKIGHRVERRGEHFCQIYVEYPTAGKPIKVDIGKIWRPLSVLIDPDLQLPVLSPEDMAVEKMRCIVNRIEPTDIHDLCVLHECYPEAFRVACEDLKRTLETHELVAAINRRLEVINVEGTKLALTDQELQWMTGKIRTVVAEIIRT